MAGIYGPGRVPRRRELEAGQPIHAPGEGYLNLIHVDDAAAAIMLAERHPATPAIYCVADGQPARRRQYYEELARLVDAPPPIFEKPGPDSPARYRIGSSKRVSNRRMLAQLGCPLKYPSYREGLAAIVREEMRQDGV
jgi:nucleoside-diphosphate-sugar epimerase